MNTKELWKIFWGQSGVWYKINPSLENGTEYDKTRTLPGSGHSPTGRCFNGVSLLAGGICWHQSRCKCELVIAHEVQRRVRWLGHLFKRLYKLNFYCLFIEFCWIFYGHHYSICCVTSLTWWCQALNMWLFWLPFPHSLDNKNDLKTPKNTKGQQNMESKHLMVRTFFF